MVIKSVLCIADKHYWASLEKDKVGRISKMASIKLYAVLKF